MQRLSPQVRPLSARRSAPVARSDEPLLLSRGKMSSIMGRKIDRSIEDLEGEVLRLNMRDRAALAKSLLDSLDTLSEEEYEQLWADEAEARYADFKAGRTSAVDGDEVFARARARSR